MYDYDQDPTGGSEEELDAIEQMPIPYSSYRSHLELMLQLGFTEADAQEVFPNVAPPIPEELAEDE